MRAAPLDSEATSVAPPAHPAAFRVEPLTGALGAEIQGIDLAGDLDDATIAARMQRVLRLEEGRLADATAEYRHP